MKAEERSAEPEQKEAVMEFKEFEEKMIEMLREKFGDSAEISGQEILKDNGITRRGILLKQEGERFNPVLYLDWAYERYQAGETV